MNADRSVGRRIAPCWDTPQWTVEKNEFLKPWVEQRFWLALDSGINVALGSDAGVIPHRDARLEFHAVVVAA